jgi:hypothetical protein
MLQIGRRGIQGCTISLQGYGTSEAYAWGPVIINLNVLIGDKKGSPERFLLGNSHNRRS